MKAAIAWFKDIGWLGRIFFVLCAMTILGSFIKAPFEYLLGIFFVGLIIFVVAGISSRD